MAETEGVQAWRVHAKPAWEPHSRKEKKKLGFLGFFVLFFLLFFRWSAVKKGSEKRFVLESDMCLNMSTPFMSVGCERKRLKRPVRVKALYPRYFFWLVV